MKRREIVFSLVSTTIVVVAWVFFGIYHNTVTSTIPSALSIQITPIDPTFDTNTIELIKNRSRIEPILDQPTGSATEEKSSTPSATPTPETPTPPLASSSASGVGTESANGEN